MLYMILPTQLENIAEPASVAKSIDMNLKNGFQDDNFIFIVLFFYGFF